MTLPDLRYNEAGLIPAIAQQHDTGEVLMFAWMNAESIAETLETGRVCYYSRSRQQLWRKGETSGHTQRLIELRVDCDQDSLLLLVDQTGVACHTGNRSCFYTKVNAGLGALPANRRCFNPNVFGGGGARPPAAPRHSPGLT
jgi:phosphoribosyl-AMP cyclohydrolase